eukprot:gene6104-2704_t
MEPMTDAQTIADLREKETKLRSQLRHIRTWLTVVQNKVHNLDPMAVKNSKRLYIGGIPKSSNEDDLKKFLDEMMARIGVAVSPGSPLTGCKITKAAFSQAARSRRQPYDWLQDHKEAKNSAPTAQVPPGSPMSACKITKEKGFAFIEFRCVEEASNALALNGIAFEGARLKVKELLLPFCPLRTSNLINNLPMVRSLLLPFGPLRTFNLIKDKTTGNSKGYAFCEYSDEAVTDSVIRQLNQTSAGTRILTVKRALEGDTSGGGGKRGTSMGGMRLGPQPPGNDNALLNVLGAAAATGAGGYGGNVPVVPLTGGMGGAHGWQQQSHQPTANTFSFQPALGNFNQPPGGMQGGGSWQ